MLRVHVAECKPGRSSRSAAGASQLLQGLAFRGTANRSHFATVRQVRRPRALAGPFAFKGASTRMRGRVTAGRSTCGTKTARAVQAENYGVTLQCMASREATIYYATVRGPAAPHDPPLSARSQ